MLTTRELDRLIRADHIDPKTLKDAAFDTPFTEGTGAGVIFGATGGVMEAALRSAYYLITALLYSLNSMYRFLPYLLFHYNEEIQHIQEPVSSFYKLALKKCYRIDRLSVFLQRKIQIAALHRIIFRRLCHVAQHMAGFHIITHRKVRLL